MSVRLYSVASKHVPALAKPFGLKRQMHFCMAISNLSAYGGLQRDCYSIAKHLVSAGHRVTLMTTEVRGAITNPGWSVNIVKRHIPTNPGREAALGRALMSRRREFDRIVGFNKLPLLDVYYSGDRSYSVVKTEFWRPFSPRYRSQMRLEQACFEPKSQTRLIMLTADQQSEYQRVWKTPDGRFRHVPPNLDPSRRRPDLRDDGTRERIRSELGIARDAKVWLSVGSSPWVKGFDRVAAALNAYPDAMWIVLGVSPDGGMARWLRRLIPARDRSRLVLAGIRSDVPAVMAAADVLVHPARTETTGTVIIEAIANGLPVIASETCGFSSFVRQAKAGIVIEGEYEQRALIHALDAARSASRLASWSSSAIRFGADPALSSGHAEAASLIAGNLW